MEAESSGRHILLHSTHLDPKHPIFSDNSICTSKYTIFTFLPKNLFEQFSRFANFYFLIVALLLSVDGVPIPAGVAIFPLCLVVTISAIREAVEDVFRHQSDRRINSSVAKVLDSSQFNETVWSNIFPGNVIMVRKDEQIPADIIVLSSNDPDGIAFVDTCNLDGETNLKVRQAVPETLRISTPSAAAEYSCEILCDEPNNMLYTFNGCLTSDGNSTSIDNKQVLLRGSVLRNTDWVIGAVVYTGKDSKLMMNSSKSRVKQTVIEHNLNFKLISVLIFMIIVSVCSAAIGFSFEKSDIDTGKAFYFFQTQSHRSYTKGFFMLWLCHVVIINAMIPISLYVTLELVRVFQALFITWDNSMYDAESATGAVSHTTTITDDLGQIEYVFSDKTGTLTRNVMEFMKCSINGKVYGSGTTEIAYAAAKRRGLDIQPPDPTGKAFKDKHFLEMLASDTPEEIRNFLWLLSICHSVIAEKDSKQPHGIAFQASSPDEAALVEAAADFGYVFSDRNANSVTVCVNGISKTVDVLDVLEFSSQRKRSSVIIRHPETNEIWLMCKGADDLIYERLSKDSPFKDETKEHLKQFAGDGLRTLCLAYRKITMDIYADWSARYREASCSINDRDAAMDKVANEIEKDLILIGATAIEDKLQVGVPDCIESLLRAGIAVWVITGDKRETAVNIGYATSLLQGDMKLVVLDTDDPQKLKEIIERSLQSDDKLALIASGSALFPLLSDENIELFFSLAKKCKSVICCRVSPLQKASIVKMVRNRTKAITLAIGDGANDVGMIMEADVGVGISGKEGRQAVLASDFSFAQFRFLKRLLLIHGRLNFYRNVDLINYSFYKNMTFTCNQLLFGFFDSFSGNSVYNSFLYTVFNVIFTSAPPVIFAALERDVSLDSMMDIPELYYMDGKRKWYQGSLRFWLSLLLGMAHSAISFFVPYFAMKPFVDQNGFALGLAEFGTAVYMCVVVIVNVRMAVMCNYWTWLHHCFIWGSIAMFPLTVLVVDKLKLSDGLIGVSHEIFGSNVFYLSVAATTLLAVLPIIGIHIFINSQNTITNRVLHYEREPKQKSIRQEVAEFIPPEPEAKPTDIVFPDKDNSDGYAFDAPASVSRVKYETHMKSAVKNFDFRSVSIIRKKKVSEFGLDGL